MKFRHLLPMLALAGPLTAMMPPDARAQSTMDPEKLKFAAEEFDAGRRAYKSGDFPRAASHFETAFRDAPSPQALRMAIRSRNEAGHYARAATLCVRAQSLYPDDAETIQLAQRILKESAPKLYKVTIECEPACTVLVDGRLVRDDAATRQVIFTPGGKHTLVAGWDQSRKLSKDVDGVAGESAVLSFEAPPEEVKPAVPTAKPVETIKIEEVSSGKASPTLFWLGAAVTGAFAGLTVASGIDTLNSPGKDTVREACVGQGTSCPEYRDGLDKQSRTNYLLASTVVGVASVSVIGLFFTDWGDGDASADKGTDVSVSPMADPAGRGVGMAASGRF